jgi:hypothetical protein
VSDTDGAKIILLLCSIDASLKALVARQDAPASAPAIASDRDLDGPYGDPVVKAKDPRDWTGPTMVGRKLSECPAEYLDMVAERLDYFCSTNTGETEDDKKKLKYQRLDASRARGWAARIRAGKVKVAAPKFADEDSVPW